MTYPSIFSRLYETEKAFIEVADAIQHDRQPDRENARIVDECLDILELLSKPNCYVKIIPIGLRDTGDELLLENPYTRFLNNIVMEDSDYLFDLERGDHMGVIMLNDGVIGGLSPLTLVYSTPGTDTAMWKTQSRGLIERSESFIRFMATLVNNDYLPEVLKNYVTACIVHHGHLKKDHPLYYSDSSIARLERIEYQDGREITIGGFPIFRRNVSDLVADSDYLLNSNQRYERNHSTPMPLALGRDITRSFRYIDGYGRIEGIHIHPDTNDISNRILPGTGIQYPYLTDEDFFEDSIIECVSYSGRLSSRLLYPIDGNIGVLLPLKRLFFDYFKAEDLERLLNISYDEGSDIYTVRLKVPVRGGEVEFHRRYHRDSIVEVGQEIEFNMAVTPFTVTSQMPYHAVWVERECRMELRFFNSDSNQETTTTVFSDELEGGGHERITFATINGEWDNMAIKIKKDNGREAIGTVVPKWNPSPIPCGTDLDFSILVTDREISIFYCVPGAIHQVPLSLDGDNVLCIIEDDPIFERMMSEIFICLKDDHKPKGLRIPTSVNRMGAIECVSMLQGYNIAFDVTAPLPSDWRHISNIFRSNQNHIVNNDTVKCYCDEIAWLIKMVCIEKAIHTPRRIQIEVPVGRSESEVFWYSQLWRDSLRGLHFDTGNIGFIPTHAARFSAILNQLSCGKDAIIVDIDAYHTTLAYGNPNAGKFLYRMLPFGINDLYGLNAPLHSLADNGYVRRIIVDGKQDDEIMIMRYRQQDSLDIIEHAIDAKDYSCLDIPEIRVPYILFINVIKDAILQFADPGNPNKYDIVFCGYGLKFLYYFQPLMEDLHEAFQESREVRNIRIIANFETYLSMDFDYRNIPDMDEVKEFNLCDGQNPEDLRYLLAHDIKVKIMDRIKRQEDNENTLLGNCLHGVRIDKDSLIRVLEASYDRCVNEFMRQHFGIQNGKLAMSEVEFWPYRHSLAELGLCGYMRSFPFY